MTRERGGCLLRNCCGFSGFGRVATYVRLGLYSRPTKTTVAEIACCSRGELPQWIAGPHPEPFEPTQCHSHALQVRVRDLGLAQHLDVPFVHGAEPVAQITSLL